MRRRRSHLLLSLLLPLAAAAAAAAPAAHAGLAFAPGSVTVEPLDARGGIETRAGAHPDRLVTRFAFARNANEQLDGNVRDLVVDLPSGFVGDPAATPLCERGLFAVDRCPPESQVGVAKVGFVGLGEMTLPIFNLVAERDGIAELGFFVFVIPVRLAVELRADGDYGTRVRMSEILQEVPLQAAEIELWGVPADRQTGTTIPRRAFLTNPTRCDAPLQSVVRMRTWQQPHSWVDAPAPPIGPQTACGNLDFSPSAQFAPSTTAFNAPSGARIGIDVPQHADPDGLVTAHAAQAVVTLPEGWSLSPAVAHGLAACDDAQLMAGSADAPRCPDAARLGAVEIVSPVLPEPLRGSVYNATRGAGDAFRIFLTAEGPGFTVKMRGGLRFDPDADRLVATVGDLPQLPFSRLALTFKDGPRAPFATPLACGAPSATVALVSHAGRALAVATPPIAATGPSGAPCPVSRPFSPTVLAGVSPATTGASGTLSVRVARRDDEQTLNRVKVTLPPGLSARVGAVERCAEAAIVTAACPAASRIGAVTAWAGAGPAPLPVTGSAYLTGPYRGARLGVALVLRVAAGPFDLGTAVVRAALDSDASDAHLTISTDRLPREIGGVSLRLQAIRIDVDRAGLLVNPTSCALSRIETVVTSNEGATASQATRFAMRGCRQLPFEVGSAVAPRGGTRRKPGLRIALRPKAGGANLRAATVELPRVVRLDTAAVAGVCGRGEARAGRCPETSRVGTASARTPLFAERLTGPVFVVAAARPGALPGLWTRLEGGGLRLLVRGETRVGAGRRIVSSFDGLPDVPLSLFELRLDGGRRGLLRANAAMCPPRARRAPARVTATAQSGLRRARAVATGPWRHCGRASR